MDRPRVLVFSRFYLPGYRGGGPVRTLANMVDQLGEEFEFFLATQDRDLGDHQPYTDCIPGKWVQLGKAKIMYLPKSAVSVQRLARIVSLVAPDVIYLNSFFDPVFTQRVLLARRIALFGGTPIVLAPRGEFSEGALRLKRVKKRIFLHLTTMVRLYCGLKWQASSDQEKRDIVRNLPFVDPCDVLEVMNLPPVADGVSPEEFWRPRNGVLRLCFLGRISPMKNLDFALRVLSRVKAHVRFTIYGPKESLGYWSKCESLIALLPSNVEVLYGGELRPTEVRRALAQHDLFFLPTRGENFGHVILEALGSGLPVLISDRTPWHELDTWGIGWTLSLDEEEEFSRVIDELAGWPDSRFEAVRRRASNYAKEYAKNTDLIEAGRKLFLNVIMEGNN